MLKDYDVVIGLEIHAELNTKTKLTCGCANSFGSEPNTNCCPGCLGYPNAKPVLNKAAFEKTIMAGLAMGCSINDIAVFERKHYFYPDLSAGFQTSQLIKPICVGGGIKLKSGKFIRLNRIHLEEDAAKLIHNEAGKETYVDYNRGGVPLNEIVTEPDISSAEEAVEFLEEVRARLIYANVANCKMEEGGMRCDVNISLKKRGSKVLGSRIEMKNLNSFKMVARAIEYEANRQANLLDEGKTVAVQTRRWNDVTGKSTAMRNKEGASDYRYFIAPDLPVVEIKKEDVLKIKEKMPLLAYELKERFINKYGLPEYDANILTAEKYISCYYEECVKLLNKPKPISNWIMTDVLRLDKEVGMEDLTKIITPQNLTDIIGLLENKEITRTNAVELFNYVYVNKTNAKESANKLGFLTTISEEELKSYIESVFNENQGAIKDYALKPDNVINYFIGQVMRKSKGKAKTDIIKPMIVEKLKNSIKG